MQSPSRSRLNPQGGFTLIEMLVSMAVLTLMIVLVSQLTSQANITINTSSRQMDAASDAGAALDRLGANLAGIVSAQGIAPVVYKNTPSAPSGENSGTLNDGIAFICNARPRNRSSVQTSPNNFIRMAMMGYRVRAFPDDLLGGTKVPKLSWGDGTVSFSTATGSVQNAQYAKSGLQNAIITVAGDLTDGTDNMIKPEVLGQGIFRFELCFLLDDGTVASAPPRDNNFSATPFTGDCYAVALSRDTSADPNKRYVKAIIAGIAVLDAKTRQLVGANGADLYKLADLLPDPAANNQTPLQAWEFLGTSGNATNLRNKLAAYPKPVLQNLRLYQRYYYLTAAL